MLVRWSMLVAGHGGTAALLNSVSAVSGHGKARSGAQQYNGVLVTLFQQQTLHAKLRRCLTTARWCGGYNAAARVVAFHAGGTTNEGNVLAPANTRPDQTLTLKIKRKAQTRRAVASFPWRWLWRPRFRREGKKEIRPHQGAAEATNTSRWWRWMRRNDWRDGDGGDAV